MTDFNQSHAWSFYRERRLNIKYVYMSSVFVLFFIKSNGSGETNKPEIALTFYVYVHLIFKAYTCMSYLVRNVICVK